MLGEIFNIVAPVFIVVGAGYAAVKGKLLSDEPIDQLMKFAIQFAIPCLLFSATSTIDLSVAFNWRLLFSYYAAAIACFAIAYLVFRHGFKRRPGEAVGIAFGALFSNLVLLGLPISERAWGVGGMEPSFRPGVGECTDLLPGRDYHDGTVTRGWAWRHRYRAHRG